MKRLLITVLTITLLLPLGVYSSANNTETSYSFIFDGIDIAVTGTMTEDEAYDLAYVLYCEEMGIILPMPCAPCDISGHYYKYYNSSSTIHKAYSSAPRCAVNTYYVTSCTKCNSIISKILLSTERINCCS